MAQLFVIVYGIMMLMRFYLASGHFALAGAAQHTYPAHNAKGTSGSRKD